MAVYTRQSSSGIVDGGVIEASDLNAEFDQLASAFLQPTFGTGAAGTDIAVTFDGETNDGIFTWMEDEDYFQFSDDILMSSEEQIRFRDNAIYINSGTDGHLNLVADTEIDLTATTIDINGNVDVSGTLTVAGAVDFGDAALSNVGAVQLDSIAGDGDTNTSITFSGSDVITVATGGSTAFTVNASQLITASGGITSTAASNTFGATSFNDADITNVGSIALDTITNDGTDVTIDSGGDIVLDAGGADVTLKDDGTTFGSLSQSSGELVIKSGSTPTAAITMSGANVTVAGDLTVSGDDITMGTNTAGNLLIADGTNFNSVAVGSLSEISTVANDDVFLAVDTSGGGLKKITRSAVVAGLATSSAISNVSEDTTPQLGGDLDVDGNDIVSTSNGNINLLPNGSGKVILDGNGSSGGVSITDGVIDIRTGTGNEAKILFYCESSNAHAQTLQAAPHSAGSSATLVLPTASGTLIGTGDSGTVSNGMLAGSIADSKLNTISTADKVAGGAIQIDSGTDGTSITVADSDKLLIDDGGTTKYINASQIKSYTASATAADDISTGDAAVTLATSAGNITIDAQGNDTDIIFKGTDGSADTTFLTLDGSDAGTAIFNHDIKIADGGQIGSASDADAIAIASDGVVTMNQIPVFSAGINVSGGSIAGTLSTAAQANITSLGTLTALTVDDVAVDGKVITMTGSTDDTAVFTAGTNGALTIETTDTAAAAANIQITADGTFEVDATTITLDSAGDIALDAAGNNVTFKSGGTSILDFSNSSSDAVITASVQDKDIIFKGDDGGSAVTPLTMDMSAAGKLLLGAGAVGSTLTDTSNSGSITLDFDTYQNFVLTATGNITLANPSTESAGQSGIIILIQDGTGSRTLSLGTDYETAGGAGLTISTAANAVDVIPYFVKASGSIQLGAPQLAFA